MLDSAHCMPKPKLKFDHNASLYVFFFNLTTENPRHDIQRVIWHQFHVISK